jgi:hypothetical protein
MWAMARQKRIRVPHRDGVPLERVHIEIEFDWEHCHSVVIDVGENSITLPGELRARRGVYFIRSGVRGRNADETDACYVGRSVDDMEERVVIGIRDANKQFKANLDHPDGWVEIDVATNIRINGNEISEDYIDDPRVVEAVESAGVLDSMSYFNNQNKR